MFGGAKNVRGEKMADFREKSNWHDLCTIECGPVVGPHSRNRSPTMKTYSKPLIIAALAAAASLSMLPVQASARAAAKEQSAADGMGNTIAAAPGSAKVTKYCFVDTMTGSRIPVKECKTKKEWEDLGVQVPAK
jgi:hypothetical protein